VDDSSHEPSSEVRRVVVSLGRFAGVGGVSFVTNLALTALLHEVLGLPEEAAFAISLVVVFVMNFLACRYVVFDGRGGDARRQLLHYGMASLGFRGGEWCAFLVVHTWLRTPYLVAIVVILGCSFLIKFVFYRHVVFGGGR
jgi:putative flippase GtrA